MVSLLHGSIVCFMLKSVVFQIASLLRPPGSGLRRASSRFRTSRNDGEEGRWIPVFLLRQDYGRTQHGNDSPSSARGGGLRRASTSYS